MAIWSPLDTLRTRSRFAQAADGVVVSIPKCGRTWLRFLIQAYRTGASPERFTLRSRAALGPPLVYFTHERWGHETTPSIKEFLLREHMLSDQLLQEKPVVLLVRDPRDVVVSLYFEMTRRSGKRLDDVVEGRRPVSRWADILFVRLSGRRPFAGTMSDFVRSSGSGVRPIVRILNEWVRRFSRLPRFRMVRYEDLQADPSGQLRGLLRFFGLPEIDEGLLERAIAFSSFENMRRLEASGQYRHALRPGDPADPESYKVRRGRIGGYVDYLSSDDIAWLEAEVAGLDPALGYARPAGEPPR